MFCKNCGAKIADKSAFCSICGAKQDNINLVKQVLMNLQMKKFIKKI